VVHQKDGIAVKSKVSWCNKRWRLGEIKNIVAQQKKNIAMEQKYRGAPNDGMSVKTSYHAAGAETGRVGSD